MQLIKEAIVMFCNVLYFAIIIRALLSWVTNKRTGIVEIIYTITDPIINPIREMIYKSPLGGSGMMIDISPIIAIVLIRFVQGIVVRI